MSKLLARYIGKDIALNHDNNIVSFLKKQVTYETIGYFQSAVDAMPGQVNKRFKEVIELSKFRDAHNQLDVHGVLLVRALTHQPLKKSIVQNFKPKSIPYTHIPSGSLRQLLNSRDLCKYVSFINIWNAYDIEKQYTGNSPIECVDHYIECVIENINGDRSKGSYYQQQSIASMILTKPKVITMFTESRVESIDTAGIINILHALDQPRFIKTVIEKNICFPRDTAKTMAEHITMQTMLQTSVSSRATKMLRLLGGG